MTVKAVNPFIMKDCLFSVAADQYEAHVSQVQFDPASSLVKWKGLTPTAVFNFASTADWTCNIALAQDWGVDGLSRYLFDHEGEEIAVTFEPVAGGVGVTATLIVTPGSIGGAVDAVATATIALGVKGRPEMVDPA